MRFGRQAVRWQNFGKAASSLFFPTVNAFRSHFGNLRKFIRVNLKCSLAARCVEIGLFMFEHSRNDGDKP